MTVSSPRLPASFTLTPSHTADIVLPFQPGERRASGTVVVVGASTGGTEALKTLLCQLPVSMPPITPVPMARWLAEPAPLARASGNTHPW